MPTVFHSSFSFETLFHLYFLLSIRFALCSIYSALSLYISSRASPVYDLAITQQHSLCSHPLEHGPLCMLAVFLILSVNWFLFIHIRTAKGVWIKGWINVQLQTTYFLFNIFAFQYFFLFINFSSCFVILTCAVGATYFSHSLSMHTMWLTWEGALSWTLARSNRGTVKKACYKFSGSLCTHKTDAPFSFNLP